MRLRSGGFAVLSGCLFFRLTTIVAAQPHTIGSEFQVNRYTTDGQQGPAVACGPHADFVVAWDGADSQTGQFGTIFTQRFDTAGQPLGTLFEAGSEICGPGACTTSPSFYPVVCRPPNGNFVVVWERAYADGDGSGVFGRRFDSIGSPQGSEFQVNAQTIGYQYGGSAACHDNGDFVVVWQQEDGGDTAIRGRRFDSNGTAIGIEFQVNTYTTFLQTDPRVATGPDRSFVIVWGSGSYFSSPDGGSSGVFGQRFDSVGNRAGQQFQVNSYTPGYQERPAISSDLAGNFVVAWQGGDYYYGQDGGYSGIFGQRFNSAGGKQGSEFQINSYTPEYQLRPSVAFDGVQGFVVAWQSGDLYGTQDGSDAGVFARRFDLDAQPVGNEIQVNAFTLNDQAYATICSDDAGHLVVAWHSIGQDGSDSGVFGRRYAAADVSGHVRYYSNADLVPDVTIDLLGMGGQTRMTNASGGFAFPMNGGSNQTLRPTKFGDANSAVTSLDAARTLQAVVGLITLNGMQKLACDVTGNGTLSSLDAARILQFRVGLLTEFDVAAACGSDWLFLPTPASVPNQTLIEPQIMSGLCQPGGIDYQPLTPPAFDQDFTAILFGDCTGNWHP
jgi:hypothetical protein